jgi:serine/threonine protein kinase
MSSEKSLIEQLLDRWEDQKAAGHSPDLSALCSDHPDLLPQVQERIRAFERMELALQSNLESTWKTSQDGGQKERSASQLPANSVLNGSVKYRIVESHARGGLGEVFIAEDERLSRRVAIKRILETGTPDRVRRQRFLREAEITGRLDHPGVVSILSIGEDESGSPIYAMKFIAGETLSAQASLLHRQFVEDHNHDRRSFERQVIRPLLSRVISACNTIAYAHSQNIIHRDIKPANIMLGEYGATYVVDWGLARCLGPSSMLHSGESAPRSLPDIGPQHVETLVMGGSKTTEDDEEFLLQDQLTRTGAVLGTPAYMSPEQASGTQTSIGPATDIYSLGATLYFVLTGQSPLTTKERVDWIEQLRLGKYPPPREIQPLVPKSLEAVCLKAMSLRPEDRYSSPLELATDLEHWLTDEPVSAVSDSVSERLARFMRRHRAWTQAIATAVTAIAVIAIVFAVLLNEQKNIANDRSIAATQAEAKASKLAEQKSQLAAQEAQARKVADEQSQLALTTLKSVVLNISRKLKAVSGASEVRQALLKTSIDGLNKVAKTLDTRTESERHLAIAHNDIGRTYLLAGNVEGTDSTAEALRHYQKANEISAKLAATNPDDQELQRDLSVSYEYIGDVQQQLGDLAKAEDAYLKGLLISEKQIALNPKDPDLKRDVAFGYEKLGDIRIAHEKLALAREAYVRSFELYSDNVKALPGNSTVQRDLLVGQSKLGNIYLLEENLEKAAEIYRQCIVTCAALEKIPESGAQLRDRSVMQNKLGSVLQKQTLLDEAAAAYREGLEIARKCLADAPDDLTARRDLSISLSNLGDVLLLQEKLEECCSHYTESLEIRRGIQATDESSHIAKIDVAQGLLRLGDLEIKAVQKEKAREVLNEALGILTPLKEADLLQAAADQLLLETVQQKLNEVTP